MLFPPTQRSGWPDSFSNDTPVAGRKSKRELVLSTTLNVLHPRKQGVRPKAVRRGRNSASIKEQQRFRQPEGPRGFVVMRTFLHDNLQPVRSHSFLAQDSLQLLRALHELRIVFGIVCLVCTHGEKHLLRKLLRLFGVLQQL